MVIRKTISELEEKYELELDRIVNAIKKNRAKSVLLQFPDGIKPWATCIVDELEKRVAGVEFFIWLGSCYGACDIPQVKDKVDLVVQFGHSEWKFKKEE